jgi:hypothetical protein
MRITRVIVKCIIILVVLFLLSLGESITELIASNINGDLFIGCICGVIIAIIIMSIVKPDKIN